MIKNRVFPMGIILIISSMTLHADIIDFYKKAVTTLQYNQEYSLKKEANKLNQKGVTYSRYANFSLNADYSKTEAKKLPNTPGTFNTTNITFNDTLDLFGKNIYKIDTLILNLKSQKSLLNMQKEQLFISLVNMITLYNKTLKQDSLYRTVFNEQKSIYVKLVKLQQQGAITSIDLLRFKNQLTVLKIKIMNQENEIVKMKKQLHAYAPNQRIPALKSAKLLYSEKEFLNKNPQLQFNSIEAQKLLVLSEGLDRSYLPDVTAGAAYQQIGDPTSYGNNYSFTVGLQIPINSGNFKESQALKVKALSLKSKNIQYQIKRKNEYTTRFQNYINASKELKILQESLSNYEKSARTIKTAYLRQYVNFNTYLQVLMQTLHIKEQILQVKSKKELEATILNSIASGLIYE